MDVPQSHSAPRALFRAASAGPWVPGHVVRPAGGSVRYSLGARPTSRACLVRQNQQRHGRPPHGAPFPPPGPATTPGRFMPVLIGHTARPVRRIFPSWQLLPAQFVVSYLRVNTRDKTKSGSCCAVVSCNTNPAPRRARSRRVRAGALGAETVSATPPPPCGFGGVAPYTCPWAPPPPPPGWAGARGPDRHWGRPRAAKDPPGVAGPGGGGWGE